MRMRCTIGSSMFDQCPISLCHRILSLLSATTRRRLHSHKSRSRSLRVRRVGATVLHIVTTVVTTLWGLIMAYETR